jgi:hypothetical protein
VKTSLGIWALGGMVTRFVPEGYQPEHGRETTVEKVQRAVAGLEGLVDDYEFHYPGELSEDNIDEVRAALDGHGIYAIASGLHVDHRFGKGGLTSVDPGVRETAREITRAGFAVDGLDPQEAQLEAGLRPGDEHYGLAPDATIERGAYERFYEGVVAWLRDGAPPPVDPRDSVAVLHLLDAARRSAATHSVIELEDLT